MGEGKKKKQRFLAANPICCFCGGRELATTVDHVPPRSCFPDRHGPEGFEFPACDRCQTASRMDELVLGFFVRLIDPDDQTQRKDQSAKALSGLVNNLPQLVPVFNLPASAKRRAYKMFDIERPAGVISADLPVVGVPEEVHEHVLRYARKMACALFYREMGRPAPVEHCVWTSWTQGANRAHMNALRTFVEMTPLITKGGRTNLDFGDRFGYRCNKKADPDLFAAIAQFGRGMTITMTVVNAESRSRLTHTDWVSVGDIYPRE